MIGRLVFVLALSWCSALFAAPAVVPPEVDSFDFQSVEVSTAISLYLKEVSKRPYMLCGDVLADTRKVSIRASGKTLTGPLFASLLADHGFEATERGGVLVVCKKKAAIDLDEGNLFLYRVKHRDSAYLVDLVAPLIKGVFANKRAGGGALAVGGKDAQAAGTVGAQPAQSGGVGSTFQSSGDDYILFSGSDKEIGKLKRLLDQVDVPTGEVVVKAYMYEVGSSDSDGSALSLVMSVLGGKLQAGIAGATLGNFIRLKTSSIDLVASALKSDGRFKVVTAPYQRVRSGKSARFVSGSQVSVLGAIVTNQNGTTQQSFDRIESGTILEISPVVRDAGVDVDVFEQVSSFVASNSSSQPTLNKRELRTSLTVQDGEVVVIAGLDDVKEDDTKSGLSFLPWSLSRAKSSSKSQLVLVLELQKI
jgi:hypothetical protein